MKRCRSDRAAILYADPLLETEHCVLVAENQVRILIRPEEVSVGNLLFHRLASL